MVSKSISDVLGRLLTFENTDISEPKYVVIQKFNCVRIELYLRAGKKN